MQATDWLRFEIGEVAASAEGWGVVALLLMVVTVAFAAVVLRRPL